MTSTIDGISSINLDDDAKLKLGTGRDVEIFYDGSNLVIDPDVVAGSAVNINHAADNTKMTIGLTINQGANDDEILALKSTDVAHGMTSIAETDTFFSIEKNEGTGTAELQGFGSGNRGLLLRGYGTTANTAKTAAADAPTVITGSIKSGTGHDTVGSNGNILVIRDGVAASDARVIVDTEGDIFADGGTSSTNMVTQFDAHDDLSLIRAFEIARHENGAKGLVKDDWDEFVHHNEDDLVELGILGAPLKEGGLINVTRLQQLIVGATWQMGKRLMAIEQKLDALPAGV